MVELVGAWIAVGLFGQGFVRLRRRGPAHAPYARALLCALGIAVALTALLSPLERLGDRTLLSAHMLQHLLLGDIAPLLLVLAARGPLALFLLPPSLLRVLARSRRVRATLRFLLRPRNAFVLWCLAIGSWHVPVAYDLAAAHPPLHGLEHGCFFLAGLLAWTVILDAQRIPGARALFAGALLLAGSALCEVLLASGPLYPRYADVVNRPLGFTAATDQARAALLMMAEQIATLGTAAALLVWSHVERVAAAQEDPPAARGRA